ncbi:hypothetical protein K6K13_19995 [Symbiopectobacterium purcellii]|uniref:Uncharacterized protein n=1 Tax=Symbiopectobacterium purcellii TaxID=2871826 RepID=A0ABX9ASP9_9ENTR|nr:hypothetical protein [Symbiopectobacterium purcellii]QZN98218.1 hypothetical protein K6K13_19995 [Symbiopectobacterium purcellii]
MAYHLAVVEIIHEINQQDTQPSLKPHTPEMSITRFLERCCLFAGKAHNEEDKAGHNHIRIPLKK